MKWYYQIRGGHTHVRVFMNGGKCGDLCFRNEEFDQIRQAFCPAGLSPGPRIEFIDEQIAHDERIDWRIEYEIPPLRAIYYAVVLNQTEAEVKEMAAQRKPRWNIRKMERLT